MEPRKRLLTLNEVANELRCSKTHVSNVVSGRVRGVARLTHIAVGRRLHDCDPVGGLLTCSKLAFGMPSTRPVTFDQ